MPSAIPTSTVSKFCPDASNSNCNPVASTSAESVENVSVDALAASSPVADEYCPDGGDSNCNPLPTVKGLNKAAAKNAVEVSKSTGYCPNSTNSNCNPLLAASDLKTLAVQKPVVGAAEKFCPDGTDSNCNPKGMLFQAV